MLPRPGDKRAPPAVTTGDVTRKLAPPVLTALAMWAAYLLLLAMIPPNEHDRVVDEHLDCSSVLHPREKNMIQDHAAPGNSSGDGRQDASTIPPLPMLNSNSNEAEFEQNRRAIDELGIGMVMFFTSDITGFGSGVKSVEALWPRLHIIDNSAYHTLSSVPEFASFDVRTPPVPLSFAQSQNYAQKIARQHNYKVLLYMHGDAKVEALAVRVIIDKINLLLEERRRWGLIFCNYDAFVAFNMAAVDAIGPWDTRLPQYNSDNDFYLRLAKAGFSKHRIPANLCTHTVSGTIKKNACLAYVAKVTFGASREYFEAKWGKFHSFGPMEDDDDYYSTPFEHMRVRELFAANMRQLFAFLFVFVLFLRWHWSHANAWTQRLVTLGCMVLTWLVYRNVEHAYFLGLIT